MRTAPRCLEHDLVVAFSYTLFVAFFSKHHGDIKPVYRYMGRCVYKTGNTPMIIHN